MSKSVTCGILGDVEVHALPSWIREVIFPNTPSGRNESPLLAMVSGDDLYLVDCFRNGPALEYYEGGIVYRFSLVAGEYDKFGTTNGTSVDNPEWARGLAGVVDRYLNVTGKSAMGTPILGNQSWRDYRPSDVGHLISRAIFVALWATEQYGDDSKKLEQVLHKQIGWGDEKLRFSKQGRQGLLVERKVEENWNVITFQEFLTLIAVRNA